MYQLINFDRFYKTSTVLLFFLCLTILSVVLYAKQQQTILFTEKKLQQIQQKFGNRAIKRFLNWKKLVDASQNKTEIEKLKLVNNFFNSQIRWVSDEKLWKKKDYWATPVETLLRSAGDCEDFTIIKYFTLSALGIPISRLKLNYVKAIKYNQAHMVLTYTKNKRSMPLVLDNINKRILPANQRKDLKPVYSFNGEGLWVEKKNSGKKVGKSSRIRLWVDLNKRMRKELS